MEVARLFVGIELGEEARAVLSAFRRELDGRAVGKLVDPALYHLTLNFLGMTPEERIPTLRDLIDGVRFRPFELALSTLGTFKNGSILWMGIEEPCDALHALQLSLSDGLSAAGFPVDRGAYSPHITLGRQMKRLSNLPEPPSTSFAVNQITLFESTRVDGCLAYIPLHKGFSR